MLPIIKSTWTCTYFYFNTWTYPKIYLFLHCSPEAYLVSICFSSICSTTRRFALYCCYGCSSCRNFRSGARAPTDGPMPATVLSADARCLRIGRCCIARFGKSPPKSQCTRLANKECSPISTGSCPESHNDNVLFS
jgi:hypothetical protein